MTDADARGLRRAAVILLGLSVVRWGWDGKRPEVRSNGPDVVAALLDSSLTRAAEAERRGAPLGPGERVDPNRDDEVTLDRLPGVGPATARRIVEERERGGPFVGPADLTRVRGLGPASVARLEPHLRFQAGVGRPTDRRTRRVDVNRDPPDRLETLPGVGPAIARRIVDVRSVQPFRDVDDLARVPGIGPATLERLRPLVRTGPGG